MSQDGQVLTGFTLGMRTGKACTDGVGPCWAFAMPVADEYGATRQIVVASRDVVAGKWTHLAAVYDSAAGEGRLFVCDPQDPFDLNEAPKTIPVSGDWVAGGALRVGGARTGTAAFGHQWLGKVDDLRVFDNIPAAGEFKSACHPH